MNIEYDHMTRAKVRAILYNYNGFFEEVIEGCCAPDDNLVLLKADIEASIKELPDNLQEYFQCCYIEDELSSNRQKECVIIDSVMERINPA